MEAEIPGIDDKTFHEHAEAAKKGCPVSQALAGTEIVLDAKLLHA
jgi:osmotically inducible protein OsmC